MTEPRKGDGTPDFIIDAALVKMRYEVFSGLQSGNQRVREGVAEIVRDAWTVLGTLGQLDQDKQTNVHDIINQAAGRKPELDPDG